MVGRIQPVVAVCIMDVNGLLGPQLEELNTGQVKRIDVGIRYPRSQKPGPCEPIDPFPGRADLISCSRGNAPCVGAGGAVNFACGFAAAKALAGKSAR